MTYCIFTPTEARSIGNGSIAVPENLKSDICADLKAITPEIREEFKAIVDTHSPAVAYLWRGGKSLNPLNTENISKKLEHCKASSTLERCADLLIYKGGHLSRVTAEFEKEKLGGSCDLNKEEERQNKAWLNYFNTNKKMITTLDSFPDEKRFLSKFSLSENDIQLIGTLILISRFLLSEEKIKIKFVNPTMTESLCHKVYDCNNVSTRVIDLLTLSGVKNRERVEYVILNPRFSPLNQTTNIPEHVTLRIKLENKSYVYFDNANQFTLFDLSQDNYQVQIRPTWQILALNLMELGNALRKSGRVSDAINIYGRTLKIDPDHIGAHFNLGIAFLASGNLSPESLKKAAEEFEKVLKLDSRDAGAHERLGSIYLHNGEEEKALKEYRTAIAIDQNNRPASENIKIILYNLGSKFLQQGNNNEAMIKLNELIKLDPNNAAAHNNLGVVWMNLGKIDQAIEEFKLAKQQDPKDAEYSQHLEEAKRLLNKRQKSFWRRWF